MIEILSLLHEPLSKTGIMYGTRLSYTQLKVYHHFLIEKKLIQEHDGRWILTDKGRAFLKASLEAKSILNDDFK